MARTSYVTDLAGALDQTIADLERQASGTLAVGAPVARGGAAQGKRSTGAPLPSAPPAAAPPPSPAEPAAAPDMGGYQSAPGAAPPAYPAAPSLPYAPRTAPSPDVIDGNLSTQIHRLEELRHWVRDDPAFGRLVDAMIGKQVATAEKRQRVYTAAFSIGSLLVGWLLPVLVPVTNLASLLHH
jgi:pyruvate/2-oxoglutarate dehydrogenase complex dihydrolipoamide acyltransferase (E2) component